MAKTGAMESGLGGNALQVLVPRDSPTVEAFVGHLCSRLRAHKYGLSVKIVTDPKLVSPDAPLVVICHNYSRIGTDIGTATYGLQDVDPKKVAVVVLHVRQKFALGLTMPTDNISGDEYLKYSALVDYAFTPEDKIYSCDMNKRGDEKMQAFLQVVVVCLVVGVILIGSGALAYYILCHSDNSMCII